MNGLLDMKTENGVLQGELEWIARALEWAAGIVDVMAIVVMLVGAARFVHGYLAAEFSRAGLDRVTGINRERVELGRYILAGLELLIVSDIIHTALSLRFADLLFLGLLVLIRSLISYFLGRELQQVKHELAARDSPP